MADIEELSAELDSVMSEMQALDDDLKNSKLTKYAELVTRGGKLKGHLESITPAQYEKIIGRKPQPDIIRKDKDGTTGKIPYNLVLDQLTSELGYHGTRGDEQLRDDILDKHGDIQRLKELKERRLYLINTLDDIEKKAIQPELIKGLEYPSPLFPENQTPAEVAIVNGTEYAMKRQHSYWQLYKDDKPVDKVRYAEAARKTMLQQAKVKAQATFNFHRKLRRTTGRKRVNRRVNKPSSLKSIRS